MAAMDNIGRVSGLRDVITRSGISQDRIALFVGMEPSTLSRILSGVRRPPVAFKAQIEGAVELLTAAEEAAETARRQFLRAAEIAHRNLLAVQAAEHRPQAHELRRGTGETPEAWHGAAS